MRSCVVLGALLAASSVWGSQARVHVVEGLQDLAQGELLGTSLLPEGKAVVGPQAQIIADGFAGAVLAVARGSDGHVYAATAAPGRVWRIVEGQEPKSIFETDKPLITALLPLSRGRLVALTAPEGAAEIIDLASGSSTRIEAKDATMLLGGAVHDDVIYAVGGGEQGLLLQLAPGAKAFETVAVTKEAQLRSVAVRDVAGARKIVAGGSETGVVYVVEAGKLRALVDAAAAEVTSVAIGADGTVYASVVDGEGALSKGAFAKAKAGDVAEGEDAAKKPKARKVQSAELWRIGADGRSMLLWQSKDHGAYALALVDGPRGEQLFAGTGPLGRIYQIDAQGGQPAGILARIEHHDEVTCLVADRGSLLLGTAHAASVAVLGLVDKARAATGVYVSPALDSEGLARYGQASARTQGGSAKLSLRTGNTKEPDDTWSVWTSASSTGHYVQVRAELAKGVSLEALSLSYLVDNRAPEIDRVEVLAPGWKVVASSREPSESRSVTFGETPFARFLDRRGGHNPTLEERPAGKQSFDVGYRTIYAYVEDPDKDALRYLFELGKVDSDGGVRTWTTLKDFSDEPFVSFEASRLADGDYKVRVAVDDSPTNGPKRKLADEDTSPPFVVSHAPPQLGGASAVRGKGTVRVQLEVAAALPLTVVRCSVAGEEWLPLDPKDGIVDGASESFDVQMDSTGTWSAVSCEAYDEALNFNRIDIPMSGVGR